MKKKSFKIITCILAIILIIILSFIGVFLFTSYAPTKDALNYLEDTSTVNIEVDDLLTFTPKNGQSSTGLIIYPGAKVQAESYAPLAHKIAEAGYTVVITPMPLNFAILNSNAADKAIEAFPNIENWAIAGHSLGGVMATKYANEYEIIDGVILYASYPQGDELKNSSIKVTSIYASLDGVADNDKVVSSKELLPKDTKFIKIEGGNHAQFGNYGEQSGDNKATISVDEQINQSVQASIELLNSISN